MRRAFAPLRRTTARVDRNIRDPVSPYQRLEELLAAGEHLVESILKVRGCLGELLPHLIDVLLVALLDLLTKQLLERAVAQTFFPLLRKVCNDVGHERARESLGLDVRIVGEKRVDRTSSR